MDKFEKPNSIDELEKKLYSPNQSLIQKERKPLRPKEYDVAQDWPTEHLDTKDISLGDNEKKPNWFFRLFIITLLFFLGALAYVGVKMYLNSGINASNVDILVNAPLTVGAGEAFDFEISIQNKNQLGMRYIDAEVQFPDGTRSVNDIATDYKNTKENIESIGVGEIIKRNYSALLFGEEGEKKEVTVFLTYQVDGSTVIFKKEKRFDVVLKSTPVRLTVTNVKEITSGQELAFTIELVSNSTQTLKNVMVQAVYPFGFSYTSSSLAPKEDKKTWVIPSLAPKETVTFTVKGKIEGQNKDDKFFNFSVGLEDKDKKDLQVVFSKKDTTVAIARPFLELNFAIDNNSADIISVDPGRGQTAVISFKNNTDSPIRNATISLKIDGDSIPEESVYVSDGFYQSLSDTVTWDYTTTNKLALIPIGSSGSVSFTFEGFNVSSGKMSLNPESTFSIQVKGNRNPENKVSELINNSIIKKIRFNTETEITSRSEYFTNVFDNTGPIPPKIEQKTTYTGIVSLKNTTNTISDGVVLMTIPSYVQYEGVYSPSSEKVSYDSVNRVVRWDVGLLNAKTGYQGIPMRTLALQVSIIPSISQVGSTPNLIDSIKFNGIDSYTKKEIEETTEGISTAIIDAKEYYNSQVSK